MNAKELYSAISERTPFETSLPNGEAFVVLEKERSLGIFFKSDGRELTNPIGPKVLENFLTHYQNGGSRTFQNLGPKNSKKKLYPYFLAILDRLGFSEEESDFTTLPKPEWKQRYSDQRVREGQKKFRAKVLSMYRFRCAVSGVNVVDVLQAAHIRPYEGPNSNRISNGICLRSDLHLLFDANLLRIRRDYTVEVDDTLKPSIYSKFNGMKICVPEDPNALPDIDALEKRKRANK